MAKEPYTGETYYSNFQSANPAGPINGLADAVLAYTHGWDTFTVDGEGRTISIAEFQASALWIFTPGGSPAPTGTEIITVPDQDTDYQAEGRKLVINETGVDLLFRFTTQGSPQREVTVPAGDIVELVFRWANSVGEVYQATVGVQSSVSNLNDLDDVDTSGVADGDTLVYNSTTGDWEPKRSNAEVNAVTPDGGSPISYTLQESDNGKVLTFDDTTSITVIIPETLSAGFTCGVYQLGTGTVMFSTSGSPGSRLENRNGHVMLAGQYAAGGLACVANSNGNEAFVILTGDTQ